MTIHRRTVFAVLLIAAFSMAAFSQGLLVGLKAEPTTLKYSPQLVGDRFEYRADDVAGQFFAVLPPVAEEQGKPARLQVELLQGEARQCIERASLARPTVDRASFVVRVGRLRPGRYRVTAALLDAAGKPLNAPLEFAFLKTEAKRDHPAFPTEGVPIVVESQEELAGAVWPVRLGVPLPINAVVDVKRLALFENGKHIAANMTPVATWGPPVDGMSIKWVHVEFPARYKNGKPAEYRLKLLPVAAKTAALVDVQEKGDSILIDTGTIRFEVNRKRFAGIEKAWFDPEGKSKYDVRFPVIDGQGGPFMKDGRGQDFNPASDKDATVAVEERGPAAVVIKASGWYGSVNNVTEPMCLFTTRITAVAGSPMLTISHQTTVGFDTRQHRIAQLGFHVASTVGARFRLGADGGTREGDLPEDKGFFGPYPMQSNGRYPPKVKPMRTVFLHQDRHDHFRLIGAGDEPIEGKQSDGWFGVVGDKDRRVGLSVLLRDVWQKFPKEVELSREGITVHFWPRHGHRAFAQEAEIDPVNIHKFWCFHQNELLNLHMPNDYFDALRLNLSRECAPEYGLNGNGEGLTISNDFALLFTRESDALGALSTDAHVAGMAKVYQRNPAAASPPRWNADTGAMGKIAAADRDRFPDIEDAFEKGYLSACSQYEHGGEYGMWNYADNHTYWNAKDGCTEFWRPWIASHYHQVGATWHMYFRTGSFDLLRWARKNTDHYVNIDTCGYASTHYSELRKRTEPTFKRHIAGAMYHCKAPTHWGSRDWGMNGNDTDLWLWGHWVDPDAALWSWYIDGNRRAKDVYDLWCNSIREIGSFTRGTRREINTSLAYAITFYEATHDPWILANIHGMGLSLRTAEPLEKQNPGPLWHPLWVTRYYELTRDPEYVPFITKYARNPQMGNTWTTALGALACNISGDRSYLEQHYSRFMSFPNRFLHQPGNSYDWYGPGMGPLGESWGVYLCWGQFLYAMRKAGVDAMVAPDDTKGIYPHPIAGKTEIIALEEKDAPFKFTMAISSAEHGAKLVMADPDGKEIAEMEHRHGKWSSNNAKEIPADGKTGLYRIKRTSFLGDLKSPVTDLPYEAALLLKNAKRGAQSLGLAGYVMPVGEKGPVTVRFYAPTAYGAGSYAKRFPANVLIEDATGKVLLRGSFFAPIGLTGCEATLDPATTRLPWKFTVNGPNEMTWDGVPTGLLFAQNRRSLEVIHRELEKADQKN